MTPHSLELELKIELSPETADVVMAGPTLQALAPQGLRRDRLRSLYFDTSDRRLHAAGIALRVRKTRRSWVQTLKLGTGVDGGVSSPIEIETPVDGPEPELARLPAGDAVATLRKTLGRAKLAIVFETDLNRLRADLRRDGAAIELAIDRGFVRTPDGREEALCEAELELKAGPPSVLISTAEALFVGAPARLGVETKAARGYRLLSSAPAPVVSPIKQPRTAMAPDADASSAFASATTVASAAILHNWRACRENDDPEGPHQLRNGLRRLRTALAAFQPVLDGSAAALAEEVRALNRLIAPARDADIALALLVAPEPGSSPEGAANGDDGALSPGKMALRAIAAAKIVASRAAMRAELDGGRWTALSLKLAGAANGLAPLAQIRRDRPAEAVAAEALERFWRRANRRARGYADLQADDRHALRRSLKRVRYAAEMFADLYPGRQRSDFVAATKSLLDLFGDLSDLQVLEGFSEAVGRDNPEAHAALEAVLAGRRRACDRAWKRSIKRWRALSERAPFWR